jgi:hypothetical protein
MIKLTQLFALALLMGGLSLHAMDDAAQLKALEDELANLAIQHDTLDKEFRWWNENSVEEEREREPRFQLLWEELPKMKSQKEALQTQIKQKQDAIAQQCSTPNRPNTINLWGFWFHNGPSHELGKSENK